MSESGVDDDGLGPGPSKRPRTSGKSGREGTRRYQLKWESDFYCSSIASETLCLICGHKFNYNKEFNIARHYNTKHQAEKATLSAASRSKDISDLRQQRLAAAAHFVSTAETRSNNDSDDAVTASYKLARLLAQNGKPFTDGPWVKECILKAAETVCPEKLEKFENISMSANTMKDRVKDIGESIEKRLKSICSRVEFFSLALDESTDVSSTAQLAIFIRCVMEDGTVYEELLDLVPLYGQTRGIDILNAVIKTVEKFGLDWGRFVSLATDGAPSMKGEVKDGFLARLRKYLSQQGFRSDFPAVHCIIHQEALVASTVEMPHVMSVVVSTVNTIRASALNHRKFQEFLREIGSEFVTLPYHNKVRWLSKGKVLERFFLLRDEIKEFTASIKKPVVQLSDHNWLADLAFLVDLTRHLNQLNVQLQGRKNLLPDMAQLINTFKDKLTLWKVQVEVQGEFTNFPSLKSLGKRPDKRIIGIMTNTLTKLRTEFDCYFKEFDTLELQLRILAAPFYLPLMDAPIELQGELAVLRNNVLLKEQFRALPLLEFWQMLPKQQFPLLWNQCFRLLSMFGATYVCEQFFSRMKLVKTIYRSRLSDGNLVAQLRTMVSGLDPNLAELALEKRSQVSGGGRGGGGD